MNNNSIEIPERTEEDKDNPEKKSLETLRKWCDTQVQHQLRNSRGLTNNIGYLTAEKVEKLREVGLSLALSYEEMYQKLVTYKEENGTLEVDKNEDEELFAFAEAQNKMLAKHSQGKPVPLSDERIQNLLTLGCGPKSSDGEAKWNSMLEALQAYKENHGSYSFTSNTSVLPKPERRVKYWAHQQRREYKKLKQGKESTLTAQRLQRLSAIGFDMSPKPDSVPWEQHLENFRNFVKEHGHCRPNIYHPTLGHFTTNMRYFYRKKEQGQATSLTDERINDLLEIGFVFKAGKTPVVASKIKKTWDERFQELLEFKEEHGHTIVPQHSGPLGSWVKGQRSDYKRMKAGEKTSFTPEKALRLTEAGFQFDASKFRGSNRDYVE